MKFLKIDSSNVKFEKDWVKQPSKLIGNIKKSKKDRTIPNYELCGRKHIRECWKKMEACFLSGSLEHIAQNCPRKIKDIPTATQRCISAKKNG